MPELLRSRGPELSEINPLCVRDKVIEARIELMGSFGWNSLHPANLSRPYVIRDIEGLAEARTLSSAAEFEEKLETLGKEHYHLMTSGKEDEAILLRAKIEIIHDIYECLRFFWEEDGVFDLGALCQVQRAANYPLWQDNWKFREQIKPPHQFPESYGPLNDFYQKLDIGSMVKVSKERRDEVGGEVLGFTIGLQAQFNMDYLIVHLKDENNWLHQGYLKDLELDLGR